jgi:diamine N-acetyltransferase
MIANSLLTASAIQNDPGLITAPITTSSGLSLVFRPITSADASILGRYFLSLSETTKALYGPHPFDQATADRLCAEINYADTIRMIAVLPGGEVIAYFILQFSIPESEQLRYSEHGLTLDPLDGCLIAPSVADEYQNHKIGSPLMQHMFQVARRFGKTHMRLMGGVFAHNERGVHYYKKAGFQYAGTFVPTWSAGRPCYDMFANL